MICFKKPLQISSFLNIKNPCIKCKWFIPNPNEKKRGFCRKFKKFNNNNNNGLNEMNNMYEYAIECRKNGFQCGENAYYFEPKEEENNYDYEEQYLNNEYYGDEDSKNMEEILTLQNQIKEMEELNCGEVNEKRDLDDWETEYISIKKRIEKLLNSRIQE